MKEQLIKIIAEYKGINEADISTDATFADLGLDSLDIAELVMQIEDTFDVQIEMSPELNTIDKLIEYIDSQK